MSLQIFDIALLDEWDEMLCVSLVERPAVECNFLVFNEQPKLFQCFEAEEEHKILGVAIRANVPIYRGDYYVRFTPEVIEEIVQRYSEKELWNSVSLQHSGENIGGAILTQYFIKDTTKGISPVGFEEIEDGSLFMEFKITDEVLWNEIKNGKANGFSIEIISSLIPTNEYKNEDEFSAFIDWFSVTTRGDVEDALKTNRQVDLKIGERTLTNQQIYQLGSRGDHDVMLVFDPNTNDWEYYDLKDVENITVTDNELVNYDFNAKWRELVEDDTVVIRTTKPTAQKGKNGLDYIMDRNMYAMISYHDNTDEPATGFRTCFVSSWGYTTAGNECIRVYEYSGDTKSGFEEGRWRLLLTRRIMDLKAVDYTEPIRSAPPQYNGERKAGTGRNGTMSRVKRTAEFPPKITD